MSDRINQLEEIYKLRKRLLDRHTKSTKSTRNLKNNIKRSVSWSRISRLFTLEGDAMWLSFGMAVVISSVTISLWIELDKEPYRNRLYDLETLPPTAAGQTSRGASVEKMHLEATAGGTTKSMDTSLVDAVATTTLVSLQKPNRAIHEETTSTILGKDPVAGGQSITRKPLTTKASKVVAMEHQNPVINKQSEISVDKKGPWVINLVSSLSKADVDRLSEKAHSRDIQTEQQQVIVKGKQYWRAQITGFSTEAEARAYVDTTKEKLGLKDVWIMKR